MSISREECEIILKNHLQTTSELIHYEIVDFHSPLQGLVGEHFTLLIYFKLNNKLHRKQFFLKTLSANQFMQNFSKDLFIYEKETFFYQKLQQYENSNISTEFAPKCYFFKPHLIVLEDLSENFKGTPKKRFLDYEHSVSCLKALAKFHAASIVFQKHSGQNFGDCEILQEIFDSEEETLATKWWQCSIEGLFGLIDLIPELENCDFKNKLLELLLVKVGTGCLSTILHSDLWTSNFLHRYEDGKVVETKLIDFQLVKYGAIEQDVVEFLMTCTKKDFRTENFDKLLKCYYDFLEKDLAQFPLLPSFSDFQASCYNFRLFGRLRALVDHSYTFLDDEIYKDVIESEESFEKFLFEDRAEYVIGSYHKNEEFRKTLSEGLIELRDLLFSK